jgi:Amt family ammonium transporter
MNSMLKLHRLHSYVLLMLLNLLFSLPALAMPAPTLEINTHLPTKLLDIFWVLLCTVLVFFMQVGFLCLETGVTRTRHMISVTIKNVFNWCMASLCFYLFGFGLMYGPTFHGLTGTPFSLIQPPENGTTSVLIFFLFQQAYASTTTTILSGAMAERTAFIPYMIATAVGSGLIFPVFGHWVWGNLLLNNNFSWLKQMGYVDFAGASVVHVIGGIISLVGIWMVGPRLGRFDKHGKVRGFEPASAALAGAGTLLLWAGWWGFNGGSLLSFQPDQVGFIILNTNLAGATAGLSAYLHGVFFQKQRDLFSKLIGGTLGGLVAVTAMANHISPTGALLLGCLAGVVHNLSFDFVTHRLRLDDPVGAVSVHAVCGSLGILCVPLFVKQNLLPTGSRVTQIGIQMLGLTVCIAWAALVSMLIFYLLRRFIGLRVSPQEEMNGVSLSWLTVQHPPADKLAPSER